MSEKKVRERHLVEELSEFHPFYYGFKKEKRLQSLAVK